MRKVLCLLKLSFGPGTSRARNFSMTIFSMVPAVLTHTNARCSSPRPCEMTKGYSDRLNWFYCPVSGLSNRVGKRRAVLDDESLLETIGGGAPGRGGPPAWAVVPPAFASRIGPWAISFRFSVDSDRTGLPIRTWRFVPSIFVAEVGTNGVCVDGVHRTMVFDHSACRGLPLRRDRIAVSVD